MIFNFSYEVIIAEQISHTRTGNGFVICVLLLMNVKDKGKCVKKITTDHIERLTDTHL